MTPSVGMRGALSDPALLGNVLAGDSWLPWRVLLIGAMGEALTDDERALFTKLTGRAHEPLQRVEELCAVVGRRGGKSRAMAVLACYLATLCGHPLVRGERGVVLLIAPDQRQAKIALDYAEAAFEASAILRQLIANRTSDTLELTNGVNVEVRAASFRRLRGPTYVAVIADEAAFWYSDEFSANADAEILNAVRPGLSTTGGPLVIASSPYARRGVLWDAYRKHYGADGDSLVLVAQGASRDFNPSLPQRVVNRAMERDPASAAAEYGAQFRTDVESFVGREVADGAVMPGRYELPPVSGTTYVGFADAAGGSGGDSFTAAVAHLDRATNKIILDGVRERRPPFSPAMTIEELASFFTLYGIQRIAADRWGGEFPVEQFQKHGIACDVSERVKSDIYKEMLPLLNSGKIELLDNQRLISQLVGLERRTARGGRDSIDHPPGGHDDVANAVAGALVRAASVPSFEIWRKLGQQPRVVKLTPGFLQPTGLWQ